MWNYDILPLNMISLLHSIFSATLVYIVESGLVICVGETFVESKWKKHQFQKFLSEEQVQYLTI